MTREQNEKAVKEVLFQIKVKKIVLTIINVGLIAFVILASVFIYRHLAEIIVLGIIFSPLILIMVLLIRGY